MVEFPQTMYEEALTKRSKHSDAQIKVILSRAESGMPLADLCREHAALISASFTRAT
jgi:hypothetical protein